jgi:hypothetical protein
MTAPRFEGTLEPASGGGAYVSLPAEVLAELGGGRLRVRGTLNGVAFRSSTMPMGRGTACLGVHKATQLGAAFERLAPSRRNELASSVAAAKREETRVRRVERILEQLREGG